MDYSYKYFEMDKDKYPNEVVRLTIEDSINSMYLKELIGKEKELYDVLSNEDILDEKVMDLNLYRLSQLTYGKEFTTLIMLETLEKLKEKDEKTLASINKFRTVYKYFCDMIEPYLEYMPKKDLNFASYVVHIHSILDMKKDMKDILELSLYDTSLKDIPFFNNKIIENKEQVVEFLKSVIKKEVSL